MLSFPARRMRGKVFPRGLVGASRPEQIEENVAGLQHRTLSEDEEAAIEKVLGAGREEPAA